MILEEDPKMLKLINCANELLDEDIKSILLDITQNREVNILSKE